MNSLVKSPEKLHIEKTLEFHQKLYNRSLTVHGMDLLNEIIYAPALKKGLENLIYDFESSKLQNNNLFVFKNLRNAIDIDNDNGYINSIKYNTLTAYNTEILLYKTIFEVIGDRYKNTENNILYLKQGKSVKDIHKTEIGSLYNARIGNIKFLVQQIDRNRISIKLLENYLKMTFSIFLTDKGYIFLDLARKFIDIIRILDDYCVRK